MPVNPTTSRLCPECGLEKGPEAFYWASRGGYLVRPRCKECYRAYYKANRERLIARQSAYPQAGHKGKTVYRRKALRKYGMTQEDYDRLLEAQGYRCKICGAEKNETRTCSDFHIDHDHANGRVRGLICGKCNGALGCMGDTPQALLKYVFYLHDYPNECDGSGI